MAQAKTLTQAEIEQLLAHINTRKYAPRNRSMMLLTHWAGLRIGEVSGLRCASHVRGPQLPVLCQPKKHQTGVQR